MWHSGQGWAGRSERLFQGHHSTVPRCAGQQGREQGHLEDALVVDLVEDGAVDLVGLQGHPVEHRHAELGLDGLLDLHSWGQDRGSSWRTAWECPRELPRWAPALGRNWAELMSHWDPGKVSLPPEAAGEGSPSPQGSANLPKGNLGSLQAPRAAWSGLNSQALSKFHGKGGEWVDPAHSELCHKGREKCPVPKALGNGIWGNCSGAALSRSDFQGQRG